ncbi:hypothetical protein MIR68_009303 [Amoeboaphelidium protococcarum]|nr:hypothetical protein MIR68_009303 [Amoeboaphelidium protococcarum]
MSKFSPKQQIEIIAAPFNGGQPKSGVELGPQQMLDAGLVKQLADLGWTAGLNSLSTPTPPSPTKTSADPPFQLPNAPASIKFPRTVGNVCLELKNLVAEAQRSGKIALTLGGDHSLGLGTVAGTSAVHDDFALIWVDAHGDINSPYMSQSGNLHGMPVAFLMKLKGCADVPGFEWTADIRSLPPNRIAYIGLRDVDAAEKKLIKELGIKAYSMHEVDKYGISGVVQRALQDINPNMNLPVHLSFDVDALDPSVAPSTGTPVRGGLTFREGHYICEAIWETGLLCALDIMEVNPVLGDDTQRQQTIQIGCSLTRAALGETLL